MEKKSDSMNKIEFIHSLESQPAPPSSLSAELQALWWAKKGDWIKPMTWLSKQTAGMEIGYMLTYIGWRVIQIMPLIGMPVRKNPSLRAIWKMSGHTC